MRNPSPLGRTGLALQVLSPALIALAPFAWVLVASDGPIPNDVAIPVSASFVFLWVLLGSALANLALAVRLQSVWETASLPTGPSVLQVLLAASLVVGALPLFFYRLAPDLLLIVAQLLTNTVLPVVVIVVSIAQYVALRRAVEAGPTSRTTLGTAIANVAARAPKAAAAAAVLSGACVLAYFAEEAVRLAVTRGVTYSVAAALLTAAVLVVGLPHSWWLASVLLLVELFVSQVLLRIPDPAHLSALALQIPAVLLFAVPAAGNTVRLVRGALRPDIPGDRPTRRSAVPR